MTRKVQDENLHHRLYLIKMFMTDIILFKINLIVSGFRAKTEKTPKTKHILISQQINLFNYILQLCTGHVTSKY